MESSAVFAHLVGTYKRIRAITDLGLLEFGFRIRSGPQRGMHFVWLEPWLVRAHVVRRRAR